MPRQVAIRREWWEVSRRLQFGSLICVVAEEGSFLFCTINVSRRPDAVDRTLWEDEEWAYATIIPVNMDLQSLQWMVDWTRGRQKYVLVEYPDIILPAFQPTLLALKKMACNPKIPFLDYIVPCNIGSNWLSVLPPQYARRPGFRFNLKAITLNGEDFWHSPSDTPRPAELCQRSHLDHTQALALLSSLSRCLALTEGPPGTGKSYIGGALLKVLIDHRQQVNLGPIICVAYTNHALDQMLENLHRIGVERLVRVGSRSQSEILGKFNIRAVSKNELPTKFEDRMLWESRRETKESANQAQQHLFAFEGAATATSMRKFLEEVYPRQYDILFNPAGKNYGWTAENNPDSVLRRWLSHLPESTQCRSLEELKEADLDTMSRSELHLLHEEWTRRIHAQYLPSVLQSQELWQAAKSKQEIVRHEIDARCLARADIIGITTSGMASHLDVLGNVNAKVIICEEAGEVLESHLLTTLLPTVEHMILIGDHRQLRPKIYNYNLQATHGRGLKYSLDVSLFERLIHPFRYDDASVPFTTLQTQRRMHPSISELIRSTLYPKLEDAENVKSYPEIAGLKRRLFWLRHQHPEAERSQQSELETSYSNPFEADMAAALAVHLVQQGVYDRGQIAILTPYKSQLNLLRDHLCLAFGITPEELEKVYLAHEDDIAYLPAKAMLARCIRVATIDNFQGEEAEVVIVCLVRSNKERRTGFLKTPNRINVLLSRAKHGMYILGNPDTAASVPMWSQVVDLLDAKGNIGDALELACPRHPTTTIYASLPHHFQQFAQDGGCSLPCTKLLRCGHGCPGRCHSDVVHGAIKCSERCTRRMPDCEHDCPRFCNDRCPDYCNLIVNNLNITLGCGHTVASARCWQAQDSSSIRCRVDVEKTVPGCNHTVRVPCYCDVAAEDYTCRFWGANLLPCGSMRKRKYTEYQDSFDGVNQRKDYRPYKQPRRRM